MAWKHLALAVLALAALSLAAPVASAKTELTIAAKESGCPKTYCFEPASATIQAGEPVVVDFVNPANNAPHNICVQVGATQSCAPGEDEYVNAPGNATLSFTAPASGKVVYWCNVPAHRQLGMEGNLTVQGTAAPPSPSSTSSPDGERKGAPFVGLASIALGVGLLALALRRR